MEEQILNSLADILGYVKAGANFAAEQAPLVAQEILYYGMAIHALWIVLSGAALWLCAFKFIPWCRAEAANSGGGSLGLAICVTAISVIVFICNLELMFKATLAPRLYVIAEITSMLK